MQNIDCLQENGNQNIGESEAMRAYVCIYLQDNPIFRATHLHNIIVNIVRIYK